MPDMPSLLAWTTIVDVLAVSALAWLVLRTRRAHELAAAEQQATLERLRAELGDLVADAERRAQELDATLAARERTLRQLLASTEPSDRRPARLPRRPLTRTEADATAGSMDPAEVRLLRDLELTLGGGDGR